MKKILVLSILGLMALSLYIFLPEKNINENLYFQFVDLVYFDADNNLSKFIEEDKESKCPFLSKRKNNANECPVTGKSSNEKNMNDNAVCPYSEMKSKTGNEKKSKETVIKVRST